MQQLLHKSIAARMAQEPKWKKLCHKCQNFTLDPPAWPGTTWGGQGFGFHDINGLLQSAKEGCQLCNLIVAEFPESRIKVLQGELKLDPQHCSRQLQVTSYDGPVIGRDPYLHSCFNLWHKELRRNNRPSIVCIIPIIIHDMRGKLFSPWRDSSRMLK